MLVPVNRHSLQSTLSFYTVNISSVSTVNNTALVESALRDVRFQARGYFFNDAFSIAAASSTASATPTAATLRARRSILQYDFFRRKRSTPTPAPALGKRKILAIDIGGDKQKTYRSTSLNVANDTPVHGGDEIGFNVSVMHFDGRPEFTAIPDQTTIWGSRLLLPQDQIAALRQVRNPGLHRGRESAPRTSTATASASTITSTDRI